MKIVNVMLSSLILLYTSQVLSEECRIALSQPTVSFGRFKQDDIAASRKDWNRMPAKEILISVICPQPRVMALFLQSASGSHGGILFGQEGRLAMMADKMTVDGRHYDLVKTTDRVKLTSSDSPKDNVFLKNNDGIVARQNATPVHGKQMYVTIKIIPLINNNQLRKVSDNTELESTLVWELLTNE